jgi:hypothetical protein
MRAYVFRGLLMAAVFIPPAAARAQSRSDPNDQRRADSRYPGARSDSPLDVPNHLIDIPTAGALPKGYFDVTLRIFGEGGALLGTNIGLSNRFQVGVNYGGESLLGEHEAIWNPRVGFALKLQLVEETWNLPAIAVGFIDQGYGAFLKEPDRYTIKSKGFYGAISKNFVTLNVATGFHAGINHSLEDGDGDKSPDLFFGWDFHYNQDVSLMLEYTAGLNDNAADSPVGRGRGYLNAGIRWEFARQLVMEADLTNLLKNKKGADQIGREIRIVYVESFR